MYHYNCKTAYCVKESFRTSNITECLINLKINRRVSKYSMQIDKKTEHHKSLTLCYDDVQGHMIGHIHKQTQCG